MGDREHGYESFECKHASRGSWSISGWDGMEDLLLSLGMREVIGGFGYPFLGERVKGEGL